MSKQQPPKEITVKVVRAFMLGGEPVAVGTVISLPASFAMEMISANKAERTAELPKSARQERKPALPTAPQ